MPVSSLLELGTVVLVICIASVPVWYPRYSLFRRRGAAGIEHLRRELSVRTTEDESGARTSVASLEATETGFAPLADAICAQTHVDKRPTRIELVHTDPDPEYETLVIGGGDDSTEERAVLRVEYEDGTSESVVESDSLGVDRVLDLVDLRQWLTVRVHTRSQYVTTVLVVGWATALLVGLR